MSGTSTHRNIPIGKDGVPAIRLSFSSLILNQETADCQSFHKNDQTEFTNQSKVPCKPTNRLVDTAEANELMRASNSPSAITKFLTSRSSKGM